MTLLPQAAEPSTGVAAVARRRAWVTPEPLNVAPQLVGLPLAAPSRRGWAMAVDLAVIALLSKVSGLWLLGGLALVVLQLRSRRGAGADVVDGADAPQGPGRRKWVGWVGAGLIAVLALVEAQTLWNEWRHPGAAARAIATEAAADAAAEAAYAADEKAEAAIEAAAVRVEAATAKIDAAAGAGAASAAAAAVRAAMPPHSASSSALADRERIAQLEAQLVQARKPNTVSFQKQLKRWLDDIGAGFGWGVVYFSLLPAWWGGQTVGKKLFGLQVLELTGKPMTVMRCLKRYGGYAAGLATGGMGFAQVLWDPNRQGLQDKAAHTVVIDLRAPPAEPPAPTLD